MKNNRHKLFHYMLILLMIIAPMRGVMATQQHCDMDSMASDSADMSMHTGHDMAGMSMQTESCIHKSVSSHDCCCNGNDCKSDCDMHVSVSLLTKRSSYVPNFINVQGSVPMVTDLVERELTPPFRPPLVIL